MKAIRSLIFAITTLVLFATSCEKESENRTNEEPQIEQTSTYTVKVSGLNIPDNLYAKLYINEYNSNNHFEYGNSFDLTSPNISKTFTASKNTTKMTIMISATKYYTMETTIFYLQQIFYINKGGNTIINVTGSSPTCDKDPLSLYK
jgi:hypothetical protein